MKTRRLGRTGLQVSVIGFGGIPIQRITQEEAIDLFKTVYESGINFIDTARGYGLSETYIGQAIKDTRDHYILASKSPQRSYQGMKSDIDVSLKNLQTECIDLYQLHFVKDLDVYEQVMAEDGAYKALVEAKAEGKIKHIGITAHKKEVLEVAIETGLFDTIQFPYNPIEGQGEALFERAKALDIGIIIMKPVAGGAFEKGEVSIKYVLNNENITSAIPGMETAELVKANAEIGCNDITLTESDLKIIEDTVNALGERFCRRCGYCEPCPQGIGIAGQFVLEGYLLRYDLEEWARGRFAGLEVTAKDCVECGVCETRCPYELPIRDMLKRVSVSFNEV